MQRFQVATIRIDLWNFKGILLRYIIYVSRTRSQLAKSSLLLGREGRLRLI